MNTRRDLVGAAADLTAAVVAIATHAAATGDRVTVDLAEPLNKAAAKFGAAFQAYQADHPRLAVVPDLFDAIPIVKTCGVCDTPLGDPRGDVCGHCYREEGA